jgi:hypothetical protein
LFCGTDHDLTDEHVIPAALGGDDVVQLGSCGVCNGRFSKEFEAEFANALKHVCYVLGIENRKGQVPSVSATTVVDGTKFKLILRPGGEFELQEKKEECIVGGKKVTNYVLFSDDSVKRLQERAARRAERLEYVPADGRPIEFQPESYMPLDFLNQRAALRTAAKMAYMAFAKVAGRTFASSPSYDAIREYIRTGEGEGVRLFVSESFAQSTHIGPHQHVVHFYSDGKAHVAYAIVVFFGGLAYLIEMSLKYEGADYGFTYGYDALERKPTPVLVGQFDMERRAIQDVRGGNTKFDDVLAMAEHWARYIQAVAREQIQPVEKRTSIESTDK